MNITGGLIALGGILVVVLISMLVGVIMKRRTPKRFKRMEGEFLDYDERMEQFRVNSNSTKK